MAHTTICQNPRAKSRYIRFGTKPCKNQYEYNTIVELYITCDTSV